MNITGDSLALVHVDLGDGRAVWAQAGEPITVSYEKAGTYVLSARVYDRAGLGSIVGHGAVTVQPSVASEVACSLEGRQVEPGTVVPIHVTYNAPIGADMATLTIGDAEPVGVRLDGASAGTFVLEHVFQGVEIGGIGTGEGDAHRIGKGAAADMNRFARDMVQPDRQGPASKFACKTHLLAPWH